MVVVTRRIDGDRDCPRWRRAFAVVVEWCFRGVRVFVVLLLLGVLWIFFLVAPSGDDATRC